MLLNKKADRSLFTFIPLNVKSEVLIELNFVFYMVKLTVCNKSVSNIISAHLCFVVMSLCEIYKA